MRTQVLIKHGDLFLEDCGLAAQQAALRGRCHSTVARRLPELLALLAQPGAGAAALTAAVASVLQRAPAELPWQQLSGPAGEQLASFEAVGPDGHLYSLNVLNGTVLLDGAPPGRLPNDILQQPLYRRIFGASNFEVAATKEGVMQTIKPVQGRFYEFFQAAAASGQLQLVVVEVERRAADGGGQQQVVEERLELLEVDASSGAWAGELPVRLHELHSHWLSR
jgi:hypothetical protein